MPVAEAGFEAIMAEDPLILPGDRLTVELIATLSDGTLQILLETEIIASNVPPAGPWHIPIEFPHALMEWAGPAKLEIRNEYDVFIAHVEYSDVSFSYGDVVRVDLTLTINIP